MHNLKIIIISLAIVFTGFFGNVAQALDMGALRFGQHGASVRVVMELSAEADFRAFVQDGPARIVLDVPELSAQPIVRRSALPSLIKDIRIEPLSDAHSRLSFILNDTATIRSAFLMPQAGKNPARLVLDLAPASKDIFVHQIGRAYGTLAVQDDTKRDDARTLPFASIEGARLQAISRPKTPDVPDAPGIAIESPGNLNPLPLVMIDAGHGGNDPGASGDGVHEKDVTLSVARDLRDALLATRKYRAQLTRDQDRFIRLPERVNIARKAGAALFVSIHADSLEHGASAKGASFYTLSARASDAQTAALAARENEADLLGNVQLPAHDKDVADILIDLTTRETVRESQHFAGQLVHSFENARIALQHAPRRSAGFLVLKAPDVPSVLIELGFLSNPDEVKKLADADYRKTLGIAISKGIDGWFKTRLP